MFHSIEEAKLTFDKFNNKSVLNQNISLSFCKEYPKIIVKTKNENISSVLQKIHKILENYQEKKIEKSTQKSEEIDLFVFKKFKTECVEKKNYQVFCFEKKESKQLIFCGLDENQIENSIKFYYQLKNTDIVEENWEPESVIKISKDLEGKNKDNENLKKYPIFLKKKKKKKKLLFLFNFY